MTNKGTKTSLMLYTCATITS